MSERPVFRRRQARRDIEDAVDHYRQEAGERIALNFVEALRTTLRSIARHPAVGSPRYADELALPGLRHRRLRGFPFLVFHSDQPERLEVWRVLHARDIPARLQDNEE